jgi:hypothetical protein
MAKKSIYKKLSERSRIIYSNLKVVGAKAGQAVSRMSAGTKAYTSKMESPEEYNARLKNVFQ